MKHNTICALLIAAIAHTLPATAAIQISADRYYKLRHVNSGKDLLLKDSYTETNVVNATTLEDDGSLFAITQNGSGYVFTKYNSDKTLGCSTTGNYAKWNTSNSVATVWNIVDAGNDEVYITSDKGYLGPNEGSTGAGTYVYTNQSQRTDVKWQIVDATDQIPNYVSSITSGSYYRLVSNAYAGKTMSENTGGGLDLAGTELDKQTYVYYAQLWQITGSNGTYNFRNLVSGKTIQGWPGQSQQWKTGATAADFYSGTATADGNTTFWFATVNNTTEHKALHAAGASNQNNTVVGWQASSDASKWLLWQVAVTDQDIANAEDWRKALDSNAGSNFASFFTDKACTQLKSEYASMTDDQLRAAMSDLPSVMREEAVSVKNDRWGDDETWSRYEKDFRIHSYEPYSAPGAWGSKLGFGDFGRLTQPTGIRLKAGEFAHVFVDRNVLNSDAKLWVEMPVATNNTGPQQALSQGYNKVTAAGDCELFITYQNTNTETPLSTHPNIKIHIVGGRCNGTFDMSRGHTDEDWQWLKQNMLKDTYLHMRSNYHVFCTYTDNMRPAETLTRGMQMIDYVFEAEERTMTTRFNDGYYRPMMTVWDKGSGNPSAGNGRVSWPGITPALFNETTFRDGGWWTSWAYPHEVGHLHQRPLWIAGTREGSNEVLVQIYTHMWGKRTAKGAQSILATRFNKTAGTSWLDIFKGDNLLAQKLWYQLWLYFRQKGDDQFFPRWIECIHKRGNIQSRGSTASNPASIDKDYMRIALAACEASQTDLYEYFKVWGFFNYAEDTNGTNDDGVASISDYESFYLKIPRKSVSSEVAQMEAWKAEMQSYTNKAPGIMFINSTATQGKIGSDAEVVKYFPDLLGTNITNYEAGNDSGCLGYYTQYGKSNTNKFSFKLSDTTITVTGGTGPVGFKIYDDTGELVWISYKKTFDTDSTIAAGITNGTYSLVASLRDGNDMLLSGPPTTYTTIDATGITTPDAATGATTGNYYNINGVKLNHKPTAKGIYIHNGKKTVIR